MHGHGKISTDDFEQKWYEKHPEDLKREKAGEYGREARDVVVAGSENVSQILRGYPLVTVGLVAAIGFLIGRATAPEPWYRRNWR